MFNRDMIGKIPKLKEGDNFAVFAGDRFIEIAKRGIDEITAGKAQFVLA